MSARDAANAELDAKIDGLAPDVVTSAELFAVVDLLDTQPSLRRSLSDPSASENDRASLARRLLEGKVSAAALAVVETVTQGAWSSGNAMVKALERQGVRLALRGAVQEGALDRVCQELYTLSSAVDDSADLATALRQHGPGIELKRGLVDTLLRDKAHPVTRGLAARAVAARERTFSLTIASYLRMGADLAGEKIARVVVARPLDEGRLARLKSALDRQAGAPVVLQVEVDPSVLGGISVQIDDHVIESTVAARLEDARRQLINL